MPSHVKIIALLIVLGLILPRLHGQEYSRFVSPLQITIDDEIIDQINFFKIIIFDKEAAVDTINAIYKLGYLHFEDNKVYDYLNYDNFISTNQDIRMQFMFFVNTSISDTFIIRKIQYIPSHNSYFDSPTTKLFIKTVNSRKYKRLYCLNEIRKYVYDYENGGTFYFIKTCR